MKRYPFFYLCMLLFIFLPLLVVSQQYTPVTVDLIYNKYYFVPYTMNGLSSMADGKHYSVLSGNRMIITHDYLTGKERTVVFDAGQLQDEYIVEIDDFAFSKDETKILLVTNKTMIYRYSYKAKHYIYDIRQKVIKALSDNEYEQLAVFSPDGNKVAFVFDNNLFIYDLFQERTSQITFDGEKNQIINGAPDWVYEEEFGFSQAFCWSPDSKKLGFMRFDETKVKLYSMQIYNGLYPEDYRYKYPKAGEENSYVTVKVYDTESRETTDMDIGPDKDQYIPRIKWTASPEYLAIVRLNRRQDEVDVLLSNSVSGDMRILYHEKNAFFISEVGDNYIFFTTDNKYFIIRSERTGFFHYYLYSMDGNLINPITQGSWEVDQIVGVDERKKLVYYTSTEESPLQRQLYVVSFDGSGKKKLSDQSGNLAAEFSNSFQYYVGTWSDANTPPKVAIYDSSGKMIRTLLDNAELESDIRKYGFSEKEFIEIPVSDSLVLNAYLIKPPGFDSTKKYPLFITVYGGPESQEVLDKWDNDMPWQQLLVQQGMVVACIDNRGTDGRGEAFRKCTYMQLGRLESEDQIGAVRYLSGMSWVDRTRIGIWGWSFGGFMSLLCMSEGSGLFKMGIAVAPVTNWRFYDTIYTERFMRKPEENASGYDDHSPLNRAFAIHGNLLLVHGMADDNVHLQNSVEMAESLIRANKQFEMFYYPDRNHNIYGNNTRFHLFTKLTDFVLENL